ncbi:MAG TPA: ABC transporter ATP-binding protein [Paenalcaligenes hominis]|uniref:ABC transporter ATP-binding protein n=1 Tax=Paenalcaligenes hominis TaxID=643674 RepID=A0A9D2VF50_9BURK|nr:ABC transporter ATP-binding protein [Paenalcaligenes hominis]NJB64255.1 lipoprotein-releasing system ATP-binding protein [Paenalcaligenes hominis]GGE69014.1 lipoprotein-releasing system ATP-binding protein LolD [Paenalcaligenes hominis]HJH23547.1 ABC transporter ATP-binding protein [Paenalcaligenes hominis]
MIKKELVIQADHIQRSYIDGGNTVDVLRDVNLHVHAGEMVAIVGASGSGKSTLLHVLGLLDQASAGTLKVAGQNADRLNEKNRSQIRNRHLGFVYQFHHLLPEFTALDNVAMPLIVRRVPRAEAREHALQLIEQVGLAQRALHYPGQLSGGERQRIALARALVTRPDCVLADEPTGNLDRETAQSMFELLQSMNQELGIAFVIVTHDPALAALAHRQLNMEQGVLHGC